MSKRLVPNNQDKKIILSILNGYIPSHPSRSFSDIWFDYYISGVTVTTTNIRGFENTVDLCSELLNCVEKSGTNYDHFIDLYIDYMLMLSMNLRE